MGGNLPPFVELDQWTYETDLLGREYECAGVGMGCSNGARSRIDCRTLLVDADAADIDRMTK